jgi:hypothetical protein
MNLIGALRSIKRHPLVQQYLRPISKRAIDRFGPNTEYNPELPEPLRGIVHQAEKAFADNHLELVKAICREALKDYVHNRELLALLARVY